LADDICTINYNKSYIFVFVTWQFCHVSVWASEHPHMTGMITGDVTDSGQTPLMFFFVQNISLFNTTERQ